MSTRGRRLARKWKGRWHLLDVVAKRRLLWLIRARDNQVTPDAHHLCDQPKRECRRVIAEAAKIKDPLERARYVREGGHFDWFIWLLLLGRGGGKTRAGAEDIATYAIEHPGCRIALVAATSADGRDIMVEGESGLLAVIPPHMIANWNRSIGELRLTNGSMMFLYTAEKPDRLRGVQFHRAWCVSEGTPIETDRGPVPIEHVRPGDMVPTRRGWRHVTAAARTGRDRVTVDITTTDGRTLTCTPDHPVWANGAWSDASTVTPGDTMLRWTHEAKRPKLAPPHGSSGKANAGTSTRAGTRPTPGSCSPASCGSGHTGRSPTDTRSTTSPATRPTTGSPTSNASSSTNTAANTQPRTAPRPAADARALMPCGPNGNPSPESASNVTTRTRRFPRTRRTAGNGAQFVPVTVAHVNVSTRRSDVYDLTIDGAHEFVANGLLVHNCDELAAWEYLQDTWDMLMFTLRLGDHPKVVITTTPRGLPFIRNLVTRSKKPEGGVILATGSTLENASNLPAPFLAELLETYDGTRIGRQELYGEVLEDAEGALWTLAMIEADRLQTYLMPEPFDILGRTVIAVDPAITANETSDKTGIVVAAVTQGPCPFCHRATRPHGIVLEDITGTYTPQEWALQVDSAYKRWKADRVVAEVNQGGDMVEMTLRAAAPTLPIEPIHATKGKLLRAEPVYALYEKHVVHHWADGDLVELEREMTGWDPTIKNAPSPNRLDALVYALTALMLPKQALGSGVVKDARHTGRR